MTNESLRIKKTQHRSEKLQWENPSKQAHWLCKVENEVVLTKTMQKTHDQPTQHTDSFCIHNQNQNQNQI